MTAPLHHRPLGITRRRCQNFAQAHLHDLTELAAVRLRPSIECRVEVDGRIVIDAHMIGPRCGEGFSPAHRDGHLSLA